MARTSTRRKIRKKIRILWKREHLSASLFLNKLVSCLVNRGHRDLVLREVYKGFLALKHTTPAPAIMIFEACERVKPALVLRTMPKGKESLQIPTLVNEYKLYKVGIKWIASSIKGYSSLKPLGSNIALELKRIVAEKNESQAVSRQELLYEVALENRALTHYRWAVE